MDIWQRTGAAAQSAGVLARLEGVSAAAAGYRRNWRAVLAGLRLDDAALQLPTIESAAVLIPR